MQLRGQNVACMVINIFRIERKNGMVDTTKKKRFKFAIDVNGTVNYTEYLKFKGAIQCTEPILR